MRISFVVPAYNEEAYLPACFDFILSVLLFVTAIVLGIPLLVEFEKTHLVPRLPTAVLCAAIVMLSFLALVCGLILDSVSRGRKEAKRLAYLNAPKSR